MAAWYLLPKVASHAQSNCLSHASSTLCVYEPEIGSMVAPCIVEHSSEECESLTEQESG